jgi:hypothetical protein
VREAPVRGGGFDRCRGICKELWVARAVFSSGAETRSLSFDAHLGAGRDTSETRALGVRRELLERARHQAPQARATRCRQALNVDAECGKAHLPVLEVDLDCQYTGVRVPIAVFWRRSPFTQSGDGNPSVAVGHAEIHTPETLGSIEYSAVGAGNEGPATRPFRRKLVTRETQELIDDACLHGPVALPRGCPLLHLQPLVEAYDRVTPLQRGCRHVLRQGRTSQARAAKNDKSENKSDQPASRRPIVRHVPQPAELLRSGLATPWHLSSRQWNDCGAKQAPLLGLACEGGGKWLPSGTRRQDAERPSFLMLHCLLCRVARLNHAGGIRIDLDQASINGRLRQDWTAEAKCCNRYAAPLKAMSEAKRPRIDRPPAPSWRKPTSREH